MWRFSDTLLRQVGRDGLRKGPWRAGGLGRHGPNQSGGWLLASEGFGFPRGFPIVQFPNDAVIAAFVVGHICGDAARLWTLGAQAVS